MGTKSDGTPDRRHVERKTEAARNKAVRELEEARRWPGRQARPGRRSGRCSTGTWTWFSRSAAGRRGQSRLPVAVQASDLHTVGRPADRPAAARAARGRLREDARRGLAASRSQGPRHPLERLRDRGQARQRRPQSRASSWSLRGSASPIRPRSPSRKPARSWSGRRPAQRCSLVCRARVRAPARRSARAALALR